MDRILLAGSSAIVTGLFAVNIYRDMYKRDAEVNQLRVDELEKKYELLEAKLNEKEMKEKEMKEKEMKEKKETQFIDIDPSFTHQDSEPSPYGSCDEDNDDEIDNKVIKNVVEALLLNSENERIEEDKSSDDSVEELVSPENTNDAEKVVIEITE